MITDVPAPDDFRSTGTSLLNLAWRSVISLSLHLSEAPMASWGDTNDPETQKAWEDAVEKYWQGAQQELATAVALAQQGTEFLLKAKIAAVSPFLLIAGGPNEWPSGCDKGDTSFADFKTIDAQFLPKAHDSVCTPRLSDEFKGRFEQLRRLRNTVMHTVVRRTKFTTQDGILAVLEVVDTLIGPTAWAALRRDYIDNQPDLVPDDGHAYCECLLARELVHVVDLLKPAQTIRFFGFDKKQRRYLCPSCEHGCADWGIGVNLAQLQPNTPQSTTIRCLSCDQTQEVVRDNCAAEGCPGNVISTDYGMCLTCGKGTTHKENILSDNEQAEGENPGV